MSGHSAEKDAPRWPRRACCGRSHGGVYCPDVDVLIEVGHPSRPDREDLMRQHLERIRARARAEALRDAADDLARCADAGWSAGQIVTALNNRAIQAEGGEA